MAGEFTVYQGASLHVRFDVTDDEDVPIPLTANNYTAAAMQARSRIGAATTVLDVSTATGELTIEPDDATGEVHLDVGADVTAGLTGGAVYDCLAWNPADLTDVIVIASGRITLRKRVTAAPPVAP